MTEIKLSKNKVCMIDDADIPLVERLCWYYQQSPSRRENGYAAHGVAAHGKRIGMIYMHRFIMGEPMNCQVDHIDGNGLNNQRSNLRSVPRGHNMQNTSGRSSCGYKGVDTHMADLVRPDGVMCAHDYGRDSLPDVYAVINAYVDLGGWEYLGVAGTLGMWRRL